MSNAILCMSETPFLHNRNPPFSPKKDEVSPSSQPNQDENNYLNNSGCVKADNSTQKQGASRKREASNILMECVKRRDNLRNMDPISSVPCDSLNCHTETLVDTSTLEVNERQWQLTKVDEALGSAELSDSSIADSGIECSKSNSPIHSVETLSISGLEEDMCKNLMDVDDTELPTPELTDISDLPCDSELGSKSLETSATENLNDLHLTDKRGSSPDDEVEVVPKSPIIQSLFKNVPSMIYFSTKDEPVCTMPQDILQTMKWKLSTITPPIVRQTVLKAGFTLVEAETTEEWLGTWGKHLKSSTFKKLQSYQKVNHYPCGFHLGRKDRLWQNYKKMLGRHGKETFNFFPETFILPADLKTLKDAWRDSCWILKPCASARGTGVKVIYKWSQVPKDQPFVVQRYISNPYLINGSKFDLRLYVLIPSFEPLRVYIFEDGLVRFASQKYSLANKSFANRYIHLTNYSINRKSSSYASNDDENVCQGHKWSLKSFWAYMANSGIDTQRIQKTIMDMIIKTVLSAEGPICRAAKSHASTAYNCFELFGFDIMLDKDLHPWLLEVNISPSLHTKSMLDTKIKESVVKDMFNIAGFEVSAKNESVTNNSPSRILGNRHKPLKNRPLTPEEKKKHAMYTFHHSEVTKDILGHLTLDDLHCLLESEDELERKGSFIRIFPGKTTSDYFPYFDHIRYYNVLLDAWEKTYHDKRQEGRKLLQDLSEKMLQPEKDIEEQSVMVTANSTDA
ncbi:hypothetical protein JTE90_021383 [Oedothorax gibbosus]|uniref:Tubulin polyglutamylase TTLL4 n=1 Tax=Oedothorax gibbosus TaxID=931172 RepID=A0AAV6VDZ9_9ARAC|nr:hypothetical protein JTE90_021383 [Oedothorax gibbosus]